MAFIAKKKGKNVLSLFDGMSCGRMALEKSGIKINKYYSSEIDKYAIQASNAIFPNNIRLGDITKWREWDLDWAGIDLLIGGSPCQGFSFAGKQLAFNDPRSKLFFEYLNILNHIKKVNSNVKFLLENVKMKKEYLDAISDLLGVEPILINSALLSAQNRNRYYWCNWKVEQPEDLGINLIDILENEPFEKTIMSQKFITRNKNAGCLRDDFSGKARNLSAMEYVKNGRQGDYIKCGAMRGRYLVDGKRQDHKQKTAGLITQQIELRKDDKTNCLTTVQKDNLIIMRVNNNTRVKKISENQRGYRPHKDDASKSGISELGRILKMSADKTDTLTCSHQPKLSTNDNIEDLHYRKLTPRECMRLQTIPEDYIDILLNSGISNSQLYKMNGNGWNIDTIVHIFHCNGWT